MLVEITLEAAIFLFELVLDGSKNTRVRYGVGIGLLVLSILCAFLGYQSGELGYYGLAAVFFLTSTLTLLSARYTTDSQHSEA